MTLSLMSLKYSCCGKLPCIAVLWTNAGTFYQRLDYTFSEFQNYQNKYILALYTNHIPLYF